MCCLKYFLLLGKYVYMLFFSFVAPCKNVYVTGNIILNLTENCFSLWAIFAAESEKERNKQSKNEENPTKTKGKTINMKENNKNKHPLFSSFSLRICAYTFWNIFCTPSEHTFSKI